MKGGDLDDRITVLKPTTVNDPVYGPQPGGWVPFVSRIPARVHDDRPTRSEAVKNGLRMADKPGGVLIRYVHGITSDMRVIVHREIDEVYEISGGPAMIGRREWTEFTIRNYSS